jgi:mRNA-degrading endonuclease RelE of RelBE toxin-antitoxin system
MKSHTTERFRKAFERLPEQVRRQAREAYKLFAQNPYHPSLHFKQVHPTRSIYSVRISIEYRALGVQEEGEIIWFWIGSHADYDKLISRW